MTCLLSSVKFWKLTIDGSQFWFIPRQIRPKFQPIRAQCGYPHQTSSKQNGDFSQLTLSFLSRIVLFFTKLKKLRLKKTLFCYGFTPVSGDAWYRKQYLPNIYAFLLTICSVSRYRHQWLQKFVNNHKNNSQLFLFLFCALFENRMEVWNSEIPHFYVKMVKVTKWSLLCYLFG